MSQGATSAPRMPADAGRGLDQADLRPGGNPAWISRRIATKNSALTARLTSGDQTSSTRKNGRDQAKRSPSATSARAGRRGPVGGRRATGRCGSGRAARTRARSVTASDANGSQRVTAYSRPPSGPPTSDGDVLAGLLLAERGRQVLGGYDGAHGRRLGRREDARRRPR